MRLSSGSAQKRLQRMSEHILLLQAELDIQAIFNRQEDFQEGRGELFLSHLDSALSVLRQHPEIGPIYEAPYRRLLVRNFPYGVFYHVQPERVIVAAIMDLRQGPEMIQQKLRGPE